MEKSAGIDFRFFVEFRKPAPQHRLFDCGLGTGAEELGVTQTAKRKYRSLSGKRLCHSRHQFEGLRTGENKLAVFVAAFVNLPFQVPNESRSILDFIDNQGRSVVQST